LLLFVDDDVELHRDYALCACELFAAHPEIVAASGNVLVDTAIPRARAITILAEARIPEWMFKSQGRDSVLYGCNMMMRHEAALQERFDEALPLYSFGEDYEISIRLRRHGLVGRFSTGLLVHLKASSGRLNRKRLAWSIMANNWYFIRKGSTHLPLHLAYLRFAWTFFYIGREQLQLDLREKNSEFPGTRGVLLAMKHLLTGKLHPGRLLELR
jgi:GT2 family glycosyltransferase